MDRIAVLLEELASRPAGEREALLRDTDPETRAELLSLAAANERPGMLDRLESLLPAALRNAVVGSIVPDTVGDFEIEGFIGAGGMGDVYRARRRDAAGPAVALKILRSHGFTPAIARRFDEERRILARLDHPAIPRFVDAGVTKDGVAYIAMELVDGQPIHRWCRDHAASIADRIRLVLSASDAMQYAHQRLIVHRDIKSSNILVASASAAVKVLDFGIARMMDDDNESTATVHRWLTPSYASPEQIRGEPATTASDVYSLGVVLYELLTGQVPHGGPDRSAVERKVLEQEVSPPSTVARTDGAVGSISADLDTVVLKALAKEPERRYATAVEFSDDLRRYLAGLPVRARPVSTWYRARKFVRRNRAAVGAASIAVVALLVGAVATTMAMLRARETARRESLERARAEATSRFVIGLFAGLDPIATGRDNVPARELLDSGAARLEREFQDQPEFRAALLDQLGNTYEGIGRIPEAVNLNARAVSAERRANPPDSSILARLLATRARLLVLAGETDSARVVALQALSLAPAGRSGTGGAEQLRVLADAFLAGGSFDSSKAYLDRAIQAGRFDTSYAWRDAILNQEAGLMAHQRDWSGLGAIFDSIVALRTAHLGTRHPQTALAIADRAENSFRLDRLGDARKDLNHALSLLVPLLGLRHPYVATTQFRLGRIALRTGDLRSADSLFNASAAAMGALYGPTSAYRARPLLGLGEARLLLGRLPEADAAFREAIALSSRPPVNKRSIALATSMLGRSALLAGHTARAAQLQRDAFMMLSGGLATDSTFGVVAADYAFTLRHVGRRREADSVANVARAILMRMPAESARVRRLADRP